MRNSVLYVLWGVLFALCAALGFLYEPEGALRTLMILLALGFFLPPGILTYRAIRAQDRKTLELMRNLSIASLVLTFVTLILNFLFLMAPEAVGNILYVILVIVSTPMFCAQYWVLGMFGWACLMVVSFSQLRLLGRD